MYGVGVRHMFQRSDVRGPKQQLPVGVFALPEHIRRVCRRHVCHMLFTRPVRCHRRVLVEDQWFVRASERGHVQRDVLNPFMVRGSRRQNH